ncbi:DpnD/PcfM family protein [Gemella bergeri]|uniref:DpnD/PcfM family protein n=1 Tax=Gemella bergeri TaxID=84136 RepID=UPI0009FD0DFC
MKNFKIEIKEVSIREINVIADNMDEALELVKKQYKNENIVLESEDYIYTEFIVNNMEC